MIRLALFDIDGTLVLTAGAGLRAFVEAFRETIGYDVAGQPFDFAGKTDQEILRTLLRRAGIVSPPPELARRFWDSYLRILDRELGSMDGGRLCPGIPEVLSALEAEPGFRIGLVTGNIEEAAHRKLSCFGIDSHFRFGAFGSDDEDRNRLVPIARARAEAIEGRMIRPDACVVVGDTPHDIACARAAGARVLAVATGFYSASALEAERPDVLLTDLSRTGDVLSVFRRLTDPPPRDPATPRRAD